MPYFPLFFKLKLTNLALPTMEKSMQHFFSTQNCWKENLPVSFSESPIPPETSKKNPAVADRAFVGLGPVYVARTESCWVPPFRGPGKSLSPSLAAVKLCLGGFKPHLTYLALQLDSTEEMVHNLLPSVNLPVSS